jgi:hypothetical protein
LQLTKLDAAASQMETAIRLYFADGDPVSIHTLACASCDLVRDVGRAQGIAKLTVKDWGLDYVKAEHRGEIRHLLSSSQNFFKHADRDSSETIDFNPEEPAARLLDGCMAYQKLTGTMTPLMTLFQLRAALTWARDFFGYEALESTPEETRLEWRDLPNPEFLRRLLPGLEDAASPSREDEQARQPDAFSVRAYWTR